MFFRHTPCLGNKYMLDIQILQRTPFLQNMPLVLVSIYVR